MKNLSGLGLAILVAGGIGAIGSLALLHETEKGLAVIEVFKFFLFTCAVGGTTIIYRELKERELRELELKEARIAFRDELLSASHEIKIARRLMKLAMTRSEDGSINILNKDHFSGLVGRLNEGQIGIEAARREIQARPDLVDEKIPEISNNLKEIDDYIRGTLAEIERNGGEIHRSARIDDAPRLEEFIFQEAQPTYVKCFQELDRLLLELVR